MIKKLFKLITRKNFLKNLFGFVLLLMFWLLLVYFGVIWSFEDLDIVNVGGSSKSRLISMILKTLQKTVFGRLVIFTLLVGGGTYVLYTVTSTMLSLVKEEYEKM